MSRTKTCWERTSEREYVISSPLSFLLLPWWLRISFVRSQTCPIINQHHWKPSFFPVRLMWGFAFRLWSASAESGFRTMFCMLLSNNYLKTNCKAKLKWNLRVFFCSDQGLQLCMRGEGDWRWRGGFSTEVLWCRPVETICCPGKAWWVLQFQYMRWW